MRNALLTGLLVKPDGRHIEATWQMGVAVDQPPCHRLTDTGFPDPEPGIDEGLALSVSYGSTTLRGKLIGTHSQDTNQPQAWHDGYSSGGTIPVGTYIHQVVICDAAGVERFTCHWTGHGNSTGGRMLDGINNGTVNARCTLRWRQPVPPGGSIKLWGARQDINVSLAVYQMTLLKVIPFNNLDTPTSYTLKDWTPSATPLAYQSVCWHQEYRLPAPVPFGATIKVDAPDGLIRDRFGNRTEAIVANVGLRGPIVPVNQSAVGLDQWSPVPDPENAPNCPFGAYEFSAEVYVSFSRGNDSNPGTKVLPRKTMNGALLRYPSGMRNIRIRLLRGDTWPVGDRWTRAFWGIDRRRPFMVDTYWNDAYGPDPKVRPVVEISHPYWDAPKSFYPGNNGNTWQGLVSNDVSPAPTPAERPYTVYDGIYFRGDITTKSYAAGWPGGTRSDHQVITDCRFDNCELNPGSDTTGLPTTGNVVHRSQLYHVSTGSCDCRAAAGSGGAKLVLPAKMGNPWLYSGITAGMAKVPFYNTAPAWPLTGWKVTVSEAGHSETRLITGLGSTSGGNRMFPTDKAFAYAYSGHNDTTTVTLEPPVGTLFQVRWGTGRKDGVTYKITAYDAASRTCTVTPDMGPIDETSAIKFLPETVGGGRNSAIFTDSTSDFLLTQSVIDQHGWALLENPAGCDAYSHGIYESFQARKWLITGCWFTNNASYGVHQRGGNTNSFNIYTLNTHAVDMCSASCSGMFNLLVANGMYQLQGFQKYDDIAQHEYWHGNIVMNSTGLDDARKYWWVNGDSTFGIWSTHSSNEAAPADVVSTHNLLLDVGGSWMSGKAPVPGKFRFENNIVCNRDGTGQTKGGMPYRIHYAKPEPGWGKNGPLTVPEDTSYESYNKNLYRIRVGPSNFNMSGVQYATLAKFKASATKGLRDPDSIEVADIKFVDGSYGLDDWATQHDTGPDVKSLLKSLRERPWRAWNDLYDTERCYEAFRTAYTPVGVPAVDTTVGGYYGPSDYRGVLPPPPPPITYTLVADRADCLVGEAVWFTATPSSESSETLAVRATGIKPLADSLTWLGGKVPIAFDASATAAGAASVWIERAGVTVAGPVSVTVSNPPPPPVVTYTLVADRTDCLVGETVGFTATPSSESSEVLDVRRAGGLDPASGAVAWSGSKTPITFTAGATAAGSASLWLERAGAVVAGPAWLTVSEPPTPPTPEITYSLAASTAECLVGDTIGFTLAPGSASTETLLVWITGVVQSVEPATWFGDTTPRTFSVKTTAAGTVTVSATRNGVTVAGPVSVSVVAPPPPPPDPVPDPVPPPVVVPIGEGSLEGTDVSVDLTGDNMTVTIRGKWRAKKPKGGA